MNRRFIINHFVIYGRLRIAVLIAFWMLGICVGIGVVFRNPPLFTAQTQAGLLDRQSLFGFLVTVAPLLLTIVLLWCEQSLMIYPLVLINGVSRGYTAFLIYIVFGSCGWLVRGFLLFSVAAVSVLSWRLILRHAQFKKPSFTTDILTTLVFLVVILAVEFSLISPYLAQIIKYL